MYIVYALYYQPLSQQAPGTEVTIPQDMFLPGVGVEGLAAPSTEDTLVLRSDCASSGGRLGIVETIVVVWSLSTLHSPLQRRYDFGVWVPLNFSTCLRALASPVHVASTQHCGRFLPGVKLSASTFLTCGGITSTENTFHSGHQEVVNTTTKPD